MATLTTIRRIIVLARNAACLTFWFGLFLLSLGISQCSTAMAQFDDSAPTKYPWSDQSEYREDGSRGFGPAVGHDGWNEYQRFQEQAERYRQESLRQEQQRSYGSSPYDVGRNELGYCAPSVTILPNGRTLTCVGPTRGNPVTTCF